ncbi:MAG: hypothetical protein IKJ45_12670 [Kiritimatiellae bacterium]|nr:hypothetical protein [Kiritimatiellia bacterium]
MGNVASILLFTIGLFSRTQISIGGKLGISELLMVVFAPIVFLKSIHILKRDGNTYFFVLILLWLCGAILSDVVNHSYMQLALRGIAVPVTVFSNCICLYVLLRKDFEALKWFILGCVLSDVISIFVFQGGGAGDVAAEYGMAAGAALIVEYKLFWVNQLTAWLTLPIKGWYEKTPKIYMLCALGFLTVFSLATGGRSSFMVTAFSFLLILFAGKSKRSMMFIRKHILPMVIILLFLGFVGKQVYQYAVTHDYLSTYEADKYQRQTQSGTGLLNLLMAGRAEFFIGLFAALDAPIVGHGSVAIDDKGYVVDFLTKYGTDADLKDVLRSQEVKGALVIPYHTHIVTYWMWHGIFGLIFWLATIVLAIKTLFFRMHICPSWFGYFAIAIPAFFWNVLFSPFGSRVVESAMFVAFLLVAKETRLQQRKGILM